METLTPPPGVGHREPAPVGDHGTHFTWLDIHRYTGDQADWTRRRLGLAPGADLHTRHFAEARVRADLASTHEGNLITAVGWGNLMAGGFFGTTPTKFSSTVGRIGIGDATTPAAAYGDTDLAAAAGSTHRLFKFCAAAPTITATSGARTAVWSVSFQSADANFAWNEFGIDQGTVDGTTVVASFINHAVGIAQGTKALTQIWTATATLSFT